MKIAPSLKATSFADTADGGVLLTTMREREIVQGVKAFHRGTDASRSAFFVTIGPFLEEHGLRPIVYPLDEIGTDQVIDTSGQTRLTYSFRPDALTVKTRDAVTASPTPGELLISEGRYLLAVANFGRAGPADIAYLDLESGELGDLPAGDRCFSLSEWRVEMRSGEGETTFAQDFTVSA